MNRRTFTLLSGTSMLATGIKAAPAQAADPVHLLKTTLTPMGAERGGNADGRIPAWTGGYTTIPAGWTQGQDMPDLFPDEQPVVVVDAGNMAQHEDNLTEATKFMMKNWGFSIKVYPTHRTASAPQKVYDAIAVNAVNAKLDAAGARFGFSNAFNGIPFPIPDPDPQIAGAQIMWNNNCPWQGYQMTIYNSDYVVSNGQAPVLSSGTLIKYQYDFYSPTKTISDWDGGLIKGWVEGIAPSSQVGSFTVFWWFSDVLKKPNTAWQLLSGQGRVRRTPNLKYDTPDSFADGVTNYDEAYGFNGSLDEYDWKLLGKREIYIPYNNNKLRFVSAAEMLGPKFLNPEHMRWELHRVWVVEGMLHPGRRNVLPRRVFYLDEDMWTVILADCYDGNDALYKGEFLPNLCRPDIPGTVPYYGFTYNLQTGDYDMAAGGFSDPPYNKGPDFLTPVPGNLLDPNFMAAQASY